MPAARRSRAVVQTAPETLEVHDFERPRIGPDDGLLRLELCGICGSDIEQYDGRFDAMGWTVGPTIPGHEPLGVIEEVGERAAQRWGVRPGDRVAIEPLIPCGHCEACRSGETTRCNGWGRNYSYGLLGTDVGPGLMGGYAQHLWLHPNTLMHKVSPALPADVAVLFNPVGAGVRWAYAAPDLRLGDSILILGAGQRGLSCVIAARAAGAGQIIVTDLARASNKLDFALELGASAAIVADEQDVSERVLELTGGRGVDVVVDVTPVATQPIADALNVVRRGGTVVFAAVKGGPKVEIDPDQIMWNSITVKGVFTVDSASYREAIRLLERGGAPFERLHTATYPLDRAEEAILHLAGRTDGPPAVHVAIAPK